MIFQSIDYLLFLITVLGVYWPSSRRAQNVILLLSSYFFYGYMHPWFLGVILTSTGVTYWTTRAMVASSENQQRKKKWLVAGIVSNLSLLLFFKYGKFLIDSFIDWSAIHEPLSEWSEALLLPIGLAFFTFQNISYLVDTYRKRWKAQESILEFALFVAFFPKLLSGPIERVSGLLPQILKDRQFDAYRFRDGVYLILLGFFKKLVIADNISLISNKIALINAPNFYLLWVGVFAFAIQLYADFSGYIDIARGSAKLFGFSLSPSFNHPYFSVNPADFWYRWNITLTLWMRDYVFFPLYVALSKRTRSVSIQVTISIMVNFLLMGLWHGTGWNYVFYGLYHGILMLLYTGSSRISRLWWPHWKMPKWIQMPIMFGFILIGLLIFRESTPAHLLTLLSSSPWGVDPNDRGVAVFLGIQVLGFSMPLWLQWVGEWLQSRLTGPWRSILNTLIAMVLFMGILMLRSEQGADFVYFRF